MADKQNETKATTTKVEVAKIEEGEMAVKLTTDVSGGLGNHKEGTVLRGLSFSAFNTITQGGLGVALKAGSLADGSDTVTE